MTAPDRTAEAIAHIEATIRARGVLVGIELTTGEVVSVCTAYDDAGGIEWVVKSGLPRGDRRHDRLTTASRAAARVVALVGWRACLAVRS